MTHGTVEYSSSLVFQLTKSSVGHPMTESSVLTESSVGHPSTQSIVSTESSVGHPSTHLMLYTLRPSLVLDTLRPSLALDTLQHLINLHLPCELIIEEDIFSTHMMHKSCQTVTLPLPLSKETT